MNFSAFGGPFSGIHQFAAKFGHDTQSGPFSSTTSGMNSQDMHGNRYHTTTNHFNQNSTSGKCFMLIPIFMYKLRWFNLCLSNLGKSTEIRDFVASIEIRNYKRH